MWKILAGLGIAVLIACNGSANNDAYFEALAVWDDQWEQNEYKEGWLTENGFEAIKLLNEFDVPPSLHLKHSQLVATHRAEVAVSELIDMLETEANLSLRAIGSFDIAACINPEVHTYWGIALSAACTVEDYIRQLIVFSDIAMEREARSDD